MVPRCARARARGGGQLRVHVVRAGGVWGSAEEQHDECEGGIGLELQQQAGGRVDFSTGAGGVGLGVCPRPLLDAMCVCEPSLLTWISFLLSPSSSLLLPLSFFLYPTDNCGETGHLSRECTQPKAAGGGGGGGGDRSCYSECNN